MFSSESSWISLIRDLAHSVHESSASDTVVSTMVAATVSTVESGAPLVVVGSLAGSPTLAHPATNSATNNTTTVRTMPAQASERILPVTAPIWSLA